MNIGLYFGTFNPIHIGHVVIANFIVEYSDLDEVWMVVTPQNPFKTKQSILENYHRLELVFRATEKYSKLKPSNIEFDLPQPNYTAHTLAYISEKFPQHDFSILMGEDNLRNFHKWKNYETILDQHSIYVYPRISSEKEHKFLTHPKVTLVNAPIMEISSSMIRKGIKDQKNIQSMLPNAVWEYIDEMNFYKK